MSYSHLTIIERAKIEMLDDLKFSIRAIVKELKRSPSTILRELVRQLEAGSYCAASAQEAYRQKKKQCGEKDKCTTETRDLIQRKLNDT